MAEKQQRCDADEELGILLMGVTGHGKSATGNTILGRGEFVSEGGWGSVTKYYHAGITRSCSRIIKVVDIPGFADTDETSEGDKVKLVITALTKALNKFPNGFHAVLLVVSYTSRLTKEVKETLKYIFDKFDKKAFKRNGVLVVTNGDQFYQDRLNRGDTDTIREWLEINYSERLDACGGRCVLFDNVTTDENTQKSQVEELIAQIDNMDNDGSLYIPEMCKYKGDNKDAFDKDRRRVAENERVLSRLGLLKEDLYKAQNQSRSLREEAMSQLASDVVSLRKTIDSMNCKLDTTILNMLDGLEDDIANSKEPKKIMIERVEKVQVTLDKQNTWGEVWDNTVQAVSEFVESLAGPVAGAGVRLVGAAIGAGLKWLFGKKKKNDEKEEPKE